MRPNDSDSILQRHRRHIDSAVARYNEAKMRCKRERDARDTLIAHIDTLAEATSIAQAVAEGVQLQTHERIAKIVTDCLALFDDPYQFRIIFHRARGKTEARLVFERDGLDVDPLSASGGGVVDVAAFALRVACLVLRRPQLRRLLCLDEPFKHLSTGYRPRIRQILESLARDLGVQIIMVTHDSQLRTGTIVDLD